MPRDRFPFSNEQKADPKGNIFSANITRLRGLFTQEETKNFMNTDKVDD